MHCDGIDSMTVQYIYAVQYNNTNCHVHLSDWKRKHSSSITILDLSAPGSREGRGCCCPVLLLLVACCLLLLQMKCVCVYVVYCMGTSSRLCGK